MPSPSTALPRAAVVAIAAAMSLPIVSVAYPHQLGAAAHAARLHNNKHGQLYLAHRKPYAPAPYGYAPNAASAPYPHAPSASASGISGCTWPYQNQFPPCMSTWPQGSPDYHGTNR